MDLVPCIALALGAFALAVMACWLMWRWRQHTVPLDEWSRLERRRRLLEGENLRLQDRVDLLNTQNDEFPQLREAISERENRLLELEHELGIAQAREIGAATRRDQLSAELADTRTRERSIENELMQLRSDLRKGRSDAAATESGPSTASTDTQTSTSTNSRAVVAESAATDRTVGDVGHLQGELAGARQKAVEDAAVVARLQDELTTAKTRVAEMRADLTGRDERIGELVIDLRDRSTSHAELQRLEGVAASRESDVDRLRSQVEQLASRADASSVLAAKLRGRLDNQVLQTSQARRLLEKSLPSITD